MPDKQPQKTLGLQLVQLPVGKGFPLIRRIDNSRCLIESQQFSQLSNLQTASTTHQNLSTLDHSRAVCNLFLLIYDIFNILSYIIIYLYIQVPIVAIHCPSLSISPNFASAVPAAHRIGRAPAARHAPAQRATLLRSLRRAGGASECLAGRAAGGVSAHGQATSSGCLLDLDIEYPLVN